jgi:hypothetical protein
LTSFARITGLLAPTTLPPCHQSQMIAARLPAKTAARRVAVA